jgi:RNA polymerase sigma factor (sigma-70 family)
MSDYAVTLSPAVGRQESEAARKPSDEQVLEAVGRGDDDALGVLYDRFGRLAYRLAFRILRDRALAEDAVQEAFLAVWRSADAYKRERAKPSTWILTVVHRRAVDLVRREQIRRGEPLEVAPEPSVGPVDEDAVLRDRRAAVQAALTELPGEQRQALELAYYGGLTQSELAERLGVPLGTVKSRMFAGLGRLRELLAETERKGRVPGAEPGTRLEVRLDPLRGALHRRLLAGPDLDPARLRRLGLRDVDLEHTVAVVRPDGVLLDALWQADRAREAAEAPLVAIEAVVLALLRALALAADGQRPVVVLDGDLVLGDPGDVEGVDELVVGLPHVDGGHPRALAVLAVDLSLSDERAHEPAHVVLQGRKLTEGLPTNQCCHGHTS